MHKPRQDQWQQATVWATVAAIVIGGVVICGIVVFLRQNAMSTMSMWSRDISVWNIGTDARAIEDAARIVHADPEHLGVLREVCAKARDADSFGLTSLLIALVQLDPKEEYLALADLLDTRLRTDGGKSVWLVLSEAYGAPIVGRRLLEYIDDTSKPEVVRSRAAHSLERAWHIAPDTNLLPNIAEVCARILDGRDSLAVRVECLGLLVSMNALPGERVREWWNQLHAEASSSNANVPWAGALREMEGRLRR